MSRSDGEGMERSREEEDRGKREGEGEGQRVTNEAVCLSLVHTDNEPPQRSAQVSSLPVESRAASLAISPGCFPPRPTEKIAYFKHTWLPLILEDAVASN